jgi:Acetyltransferase (GNAT) family.
MSTLVIEDVAFDSGLAEEMIGELQEEYVARYGGRDETVVEAAQFAPPYGVFVVATVDDEPIGCAGLRHHDDGVVEVKRMFVRSTHRRRGHARALLRALEDRARTGGYRRVILETGLRQPEAVALYASEGYAPIDGFGHYKDAPLSRSFAKELDGDVEALW